MKYWLVIPLAVLGLSACVSPLNQIDWDSSVFVGEDGTLYASGKGMRENDAIATTTEIAGAACTAQGAKSKVVRTETEYTGKYDEVTRVEMMHDYDIADKVYKEAMEQWATEADEINRSFLSTDYQTRQTKLEALTKPDAPIPPTGIGKDYAATVYFKCVSSR